MSPTEASIWLDNKTRRFSLSEVPFGVVQDSLSSPAGTQINDAFNNQNRIVEDAALSEFSQRPMFALAAEID